MTNWFAKRLYRAGFVAGAFFGGLVEAAISGANSGWNGWAQR